MKKAFSLFALVFCFSLILGIPGDSQNPQVPVWGNATKLIDTTNEEFGVAHTAGVLQTIINSSALPSGASTEAKQDDLITELQLKADLTETQPVSAASLPLPSGAATAAKQLAANHTVDIQAKTGDATYQTPRLDSSTHALETIEYAHHEIHAGNSFAIHIIEVDFDKASEIGVLFTTPNTTEWIHLVPLVDCGTTAQFDILEAPTIDTGNYPTTFYTPRNRDRNSNHTSVISSVRASPVANQSSLKLKADTTPVSADGTVVHCEIVGTGRQGGGIGNRDSDEYILKQNTTYYFRLKGLGTGSDNSVATIELSFYEHTNKTA